MEIIYKEIIDKLESITKTFVVRGNNDKDEWGLTLPEYREIEMDEVLIYVAHNKEDIPKEVVDYFDLTDLGDPSVPPRFDCQRCDGKMEPTYYVNHEGFIYKS